MWKLFAFLNKLYLASDSSELYSTYLSSKFLLVSSRSLQIWYLKNKRLSLFLVSVFTTSFNCKEPLRKLTKLIFCEVQATLEIMVFRAVLMKFSFETVTHSHAKLHAILHGMTLFYIFSILCHFSPKIIKSVALEDSCNLY